MSDTIKVAGLEFPFPADMEAAVKVGADDLFNLRLAMVEPVSYCGMLRKSLQDALHVAGEIDGPVGRLASEEILRLVTRAAKIDRRLKALGKAVER